MHQFYKSNKTTWIRHCFPPFFHLHIYITKPMIKSNVHSSWQSPLINLKKMKTKLWPLRASRNLLTVWRSEFLVYQMLFIQLSKSKCFQTCDPSKIHINRRKKNMKRSRNDSCKIARIGVGNKVTSCHTM